MPQVFHVVRCCDCATFQVQQVKKVRKWSCKVCGQKQSLIKEYGSGSGANCRHHVQKLNSLRQEMDLKEFEKNLAVLCQPEQEQQQQQQLQNFEEDTEETDERNSSGQTCNKWQKFLGSNPGTESVPGVSEEDYILNNVDQFDAGNFQSLTKRPKWLVSESNPYRKTISEDPDAFDERHIMAPRRESFLSAEQCCPPSRKNTGDRNMKKHRSIKNVPFTNTFTDDRDVTDIQFVSNSGRHHGNVFKPASHVTASHVTASHPMASATTTSTSTTTTASTVKRNGVKCSYLKRRPSLDDRSSPCKASGTLSSLHQESQLRSGEVVQSTGSKSSKWSHFLSNTNKSEDSVGDSDDDDDDNDGDGDGVGNGSNGCNSGVVSDGGVGGSGKNPSLVTQLQPYKRSQHEISTNRSGLLCANNDDTSFKKGYIEDFSCQRSNHCLPLTSVCQNSTVTSGTVAHKDLTDMENMFNLDENEFDFTF